jgi:hypothetical protein
MMVSVFLLLTTDSNVIIFKIEAWIKKDRLDNLTIFFISSHASCDS